MATTYDLWLKTPTGETVAVLDMFLSMQYQRTVNKVGTVKVILPWGAYDPALFVDDAILEVWRSVDGRAPYLEGGTIFFLYDSYKRLSADGKKTIELDFNDALQLVDNHNIAYDANTSQAQKSDFADNVLKAFVRENLGTLATDTTRNITSLAVQADASMAPSVSKGASRRNLLTILQEIAAASWTAGTYLAFDVVSLAPATGVSLEFRTYTGYRGTDHSSSGGNALILDPNNGNLTELERAIVRTGSANFVYAGGQGQGDLRYVTSVQDSTFSQETAFSRIEEWVDARNLSDPTSVLDDANAELRAKRIKRTLTARYVDTPGIRYGVNFGYGDFLTATWDNEQWDMRAESVGITVEGATESLDIVLRGDK